MDLSVVLFIIGLILAAVVLIQTRAQSLLAWGLAAVALGLLLPTFMTKG